MSLPFFFVDDLSQASIVLDEDTSKHIAGVLRMQKGEELLLTNGKGEKARATVEDDHRKRCVVAVYSMEKADASARKVVIGISLVKNAARFEWFLEKATEMGVSEIIPLICERTEKEKFRFDRMQNILVSAMLQSQQSWLPVLHQPTEFTAMIEDNSVSAKFIAHCLPEKKTALTEVDADLSHPVILIGPEGDFTPKEIELAIQHQFLPVALGQTRLRTETAGMVAAALLCIR